MDTYQIQPPDIVQIIFEPHAKAAAFCVFLALILAVILAAVNLTK